MGYYIIQYLTSPYKVDKFDIFLYYSGFENVEFLKIVELEFLNSQHLLKF